ncbi:unnamed protein product [Phytophthora fragariaefolia]|uniref:Unnamed protein product n=1 Tax=Phytophthora fragariaefolia TaxID=1490495 RepID=A0A9W7CP90_9STRA|nr:unnamed protein product [Phytophthora fragariaefolia]
MTQRQPEEWRIPCHPEAVINDEESAKQAVNLFARDHGYALVVKFVQRDGSGCRRRLVMAWDRHRSRRAYVSRSIKRRVNAASRRCNCPMELSIVRRVDPDTSVETWRVEYRESAIIHNHAPSIHPAAHPVHRRAARTQEVRSTIAADAELGVNAAQTMSRLNSHGIGRLIVQRDVYNERQRVMDLRVGSMSRVEPLLNELQGEVDFVGFQQDDNLKITHLFFAYVSAINIYRENFDVVQLDCTYKTNRATGLRLGITQLKAMISQYDIQLPQVFYSDAELALINAVEVVFPGIPHLLCLWHIVKNVETHASTNIYRQIRDDRVSRSGTVTWKDSEAHRNFCDAFLRVVSSPTEAEYEFRHLELYMLSSVEAAYVDDVWLSLWKRRIVRCWTNSVVHFGMQATSQVEGYHSTLKKWLLTSRGDLLTLHSRIRHWWVLSTNKYWAAKATDETRVINRLRQPLYDGVNTVISSYALKQTEAMRVNTEALLRPCTGTYFHSRGMPCAHQIHSAFTCGVSLQPDQFHPHWWMNRNRTPQAPPARPLEPDSIVDRRAQCRLQRQRARRRGNGRWGTRRAPSSFELSMLPGRTIE